MILAAPLLAGPEAVDLSDRLQHSWNETVDHLLRLVAALPLLLVAVAIVASAWWLGRLLSRRPRLPWLRSENPYLDGLLRRLIRVAILLAGVLLALDLLGATALVGAVLGSAGVAGLVLGFAFKDIAENYVAGVLLSLRRPFAPGDHLVIESFEGKVVALNARNTLMMTLDGNHLTLPNALVFKSVVLNYSANPKRRFDVAMTIDAAESMHEAQAVAMERIRAVDGVLESPAPSWTAEGYASNGGISLRFFGWIDQRASDLPKVRSQALRAVKAGFEEARIAGPRAVQYVYTAPATTAADPGPAPPPEPARSGDTSVNHDIDRQLAEAQRASKDNMLDCDPAATAAAGRIAPAPAQPEAPPPSGERSPD